MIPVDGSMTWVVPAKGYPSEVVSTLDRPVAVAMEIFELESVPVEGPIRVGVLDPVLEVVQPEVQGGSYS